METIATHLDQFAVCEICDDVTWHVTMTVRRVTTNEIVNHEIACETCLLSDV
jgi:hypothetical protein